MTELNNIQEITEILNIFKTEEKHLTKSFLGCSFIVFHISHRKAINKLLKNGFSVAGNPLYLTNKNNIVVYKTASQYPNYFLCGISLNDYNQLKITIPEILNN